MKKSIVAGAASIALAAMPVVGAFAATSVTDTITANVVGGCAFARTAGLGTYTTSLLADAVSEHFASSTFDVTCNFGTTDDPVTHNIQVTADFTALTDGTNSINYSDSAVAAGTEGWNAAKGDLSATSTPIANGADLINVAGADANQSATVWYSVATAADTAEGTYTGYATYTLADN